MSCSLLYLKYLENCLALSSCSIDEMVNKQATITFMILLALGQVVWALMIVLSTLGASIAIHGVETHKNKKCVLQEST
jgi:hypothetical protein